MAFKIVDESFGQLTYTRVYQGTLAKGDTTATPRTGKTARSAGSCACTPTEREDIDAADAGDIVAMVGVDCASGDTYLRRGIELLAGEDLRGRAGHRSWSSPRQARPTRTSWPRPSTASCREDPTFRVARDRETGETLIPGMGELHLDVYVERIRREYKANVTVGAPKVSYREAPTREAEFNCKHKKQTGGSGQYAHVVGRLVPLPPRRRSLRVRERRHRRAHPEGVHPGVRQGLRGRARGKGPLAGYEIVRVKMFLEDGTYHDVDSVRNGLPDLRHRGLRAGLHAVEAGVAGADR